MRRGVPTWLAFEIDVGHGEVVSIADDVGDPAIFLDGPWCGKAALASLRYRFAPRRRVSLRGARDDKRLPHERSFELETAPQQFFKHLRR
jgi:hypothetical protein